MSVQAALRTGLSPALPRSHSPTWALSFSTEHCELKAQVALISGKPSLVRFPVSLSHLFPIV